MFPTFHPRRFFKEHPMSAPARTQPRLRSGDRVVLTRDYITSPVVGVTVLAGSVGRIVELRPDRSAVVVMRPVEGGAVRIVVHELCDLSPTAEAIDETVEALMALIGGAS